MSDPIRIQASHQPESSSPPPPSSIGYLITAVIFFLMGFLVAGLLGFNVLEENLTADPTRVAEAVDSTRIALTPTVTPIPPTATYTPPQLTHSQRDHILEGDDSAPITLVEFSDYQCPWCGIFAQDTMPKLLERYDGYVKFVYRDFPIFGELSLHAAHAAQCAADQDRFKDYHFMLFDSRSEDPPATFDDPTLLQLATDLGLDDQQFQSCLAEDGIEQEIIQNYIDAQHLLGQAGTPIFLINGRRVEGAGSAEYFSRLIDEELKNLGIEPPA